MMNRHRDASSSSHTEPLKAPSRGLLARPGRVIAMASVLAVAPMVTGFPQFSAPAGPHPVTAHVHKVGFVKSSVAALRTARNATGSVVRASGAPDPVTTARAAAVTPVQDVAGPVTVVGVSWPRGAVSAHGQFQIRTLSGSTWSQWQSLDVETGGPDPAEAAAASAPGGTSPYIVTGASKYEVRSLTTDATVPAAATVQAVDPGTSSADSVQPAPGAASAATAKPAIYTRAQWGANEGLRRAGPSYGTIQVGFVHHTDSANNYSSASVPAMIRGMYAYHVQTLGWSDIGYNFLVDRFGRIWEGRYGGMDKPVVGAQTLNYNAVSMGVSAIGQYDVAAVPQAMTNAFKAVFAWKFDLVRIPATGTGPVVAYGKHLQRVSGHRDAYSTACPGRYLYAKLPEIRSGAAAIMAASATSVPSPVTGSLGVFSPGDFSGDGKADILDITRSGDLYLRRGTGAGGFTGAGTRIGLGWGVFVKVFSPGDYTGDGRADILGIKANGDLYLYRGNGAGGFAGAGTRIGSGWGVFGRVFSPGDYSGDGRADILGIKANGDLYLYRGNGRGGFAGGGTKIGLGWSTFTMVFGHRDFSGDGRSDILGIKANGDLYLYRGNGTGGFAGGGTRIGSGWGMGA